MFAAGQHAGTGHEEHFHDIRNPPWRTDRDRKTGDGGAQEARR